MSVSALATTPDKGTSVPVSAVSMSVDNTTFIDVNRILMFVTNQGSFGRDLAAVFGYDYGTWWPYAGDTWTIANNVGGAGDHSPQYCAGIWLGGKVDGAIRVAVAEYGNFEYTPGPMEDGTFTPDEPAFKVYRLHRDSLADNPNDDYADWPADQGAPVNTSGVPAMLGDQMLWSVYNDADPSLHTNDCGETAPLGIEVQQTVYAYDRLGYLGDVLFIQYILHNHGHNDISDLYISLWSDPDLGNAGDDLVGCDTMSGIYFVYNGSNLDVQYGSAPPAAGFRVLAGPVVPSPGDSAYFNCRWIQGYKNTGMTSFTKIAAGVGPSDYYETYNLMQGLTRTGDPYIYDGNSLKYMHSGDPVAATGDLDTSPYERRMMASFGPFDFNPGDRQYLLIAYAVGKGADYLQSVTTVKSILNLIDDLPTILIQEEEEEEDDDEPSELPTTFDVRQNYPNPFNPSTTIEYSLSESARVTVDIFNVSGQRVKRLVDKTQPTGEYSIIWHGDDENGERVSSGLYFYRVKAGDKTDFKKMVRLK